MAAEKEAQRDEVEWQMAPGFKESWKRHKSEVVSEAMTEFNRCKRSKPPERLPRGMKDHKLEGPLKDYRECHLDGDVLLIYKPLPGGAIKLLQVCTHDDIRGPRARALAEALKE
jgi:mRNA interferase YafQ